MQKYKRFTPKFTVFYIAKKSHVAQILAFFRFSLPDPFAARVAPAHRFYSFAPPDSP